MWSDKHHISSTVFDRISSPTSSAPRADDWPSNRVTDDHQRPPLPSSSRAERRSPPPLRGGGGGGGGGATGAGGPPPPPPLSSRRVHTTTISSHQGSGISSRRIPPPSTSLRDGDLRDHMTQSDSRGNKPRMTFSTSNTSKPSRSIARHDDRDYSPPGRHYPQQQRRSGAPIDDRPPFRRQSPPQRGDRAYRRPLEERPRSHDREVLIRPELYRRKPEPEINRRKDEASSFRSDDHGEKRWQDESGRHNNLSPRPPRRFESFNRSSRPELASLRSRRNPSPPSHSPPRLSRPALRSNHQSNTDMKTPPPSQSLEPPPPAAAAGVQTSSPKRARLEDQTPRLRASGMSEQSETDPPAPLPSSSLRPPPHRATPPLIMPLRKAMSMTTNLDNLMFPDIGGNSPISINMSQLRGRGVGALMVLYEYLSLRCLRYRCGVTEEWLTARMPKKQRAVRSSRERSWFVRKYTDRESLTQDESSFWDSLNHDETTTLKNRLDSSKELLYPDELVSWYLDPSKVRENHPERYTQLNDHFSFVTRAHLWCLRPGKITEGSGSGNGGGGGGGTTTTTAAASGGCDVQENNSSVELNADVINVWMSLLADHYNRHPPCVQEIDQPNNDRWQHSHEEAGSIAEPTPSPPPKREKEEEVKEEKQAEKEAASVIREEMGERESGLTVTKEKEEREAEEGTSSSSSVKKEKSSSSVKVEDVEMRDAPSPPPPPPPPAPPPWTTLFLSTDFISVFDLTLSAGIMSGSYKKEDSSDILKMLHSSRWYVNGAGRATTVNAHTPGTITEACQKIFRFMRRRKYNVWQHRMVIWPVNYMTSHWVLIVSDMLEHKLYYVDSYSDCYADEFKSYLSKRKSHEPGPLDGISRSIEDLAASNPGWLHLYCIERYLKFDFMQRNPQADPNTSPELRSVWPRISARGLPQQSSSSLDCGVYACQFARCIALYGPKLMFDFDNSHMSTLRRAMAVCIGAGKIFECPKTVLDHLAHVVDDASGVDDPDSSGGVGGGAGSGSGGATEEIVVINKKEENPT